MNSGRSWGIVRCFRLRSFAGVEGGDSNVDLGLVLGLVLGLGGGGDGKVEYELGPGLRLRLGGVDECYMRG